MSTHECLQQCHTENNPKVNLPWSRDDAVYLHNRSLSRNKKEQSTHALDFAREP